MPGVQYKMKLLLLRKGLIRFGSLLALSESRWKRDLNVRFNEVPKVTAAGGEAPSWSEKR